MLSVVALWKPYALAKVMHQDETDSTNSELLRRGGPQGTTLRAAMQHQGRGRHQRNWSSYPGHCLLRGCLLLDLTHPIRQWTSCSSGLPSNVLFNGLRMRVKPMLL